MDSCRTPAAIVVVVILSSSASLAKAQTDYWTYQGSGDWSVGTNWSLGMPTSSDVVRIGYSPGYTGDFSTTYSTGAMSIAQLISAEDFNLQGGTLSLQSSVQKSTVGGLFSMSGGTLGGSSTVDATNGFVWSGGTIGGSAKLLSSATATFEGGGTLALSGSAMLQNSGTANWDAANFSAGSSSGFSNLANGVLDINADESFTGGSFSNAGSIVKDGTTGVTDISASFSNSDTLTVDEGTISLIAPASYVNTGTMTASGSSAYLLFSGGNYSASKLGTLTTTNGGTILFEGTLNIDTATWNASGFGTGNGLVFSNATVNGNFNTIKNSAALQFGAGTTVLKGVEFDSGFSIQPGATVDMVSGILNNGTAIVTLGATMDVSGGYLQTSITGGAITNDGLVQAEGSDGYLDATYGGDITNNGQMTASGATLHIIGGGPTNHFDNAGTISVTNGGAVYIESDSPNNRDTWGNSGSITATGVGSEIELGGTVTTATMANVHLVGGATATIDAGLFNLQGGSFDVSTFGPANSLGVSNYGEIENGTIQNSNLLTFLRPDIHEVGSATLSNVTLNGGLNVTDTQLFFNNNVESLGAVNLSNYAQLFLNASSPTVDYEINSLPGGSQNLLQLGGGYTTATIAPTGFIHGTNLIVDDSFGTIVNNGTIQADGGPGTLVVEETIFQNNGTIAARDGATLQIQGSSDNTTFNNLVGTTLTGGTYVVNAGSSLQIANANIVTNAANIQLNGANSNFQDLNGNDALQHLTTNSGSLSISGGRNLSPSTPLTNSGAVNVGAGSTLTTSSYTQTTGTTEVDGVLQSSVSLLGGSLSGTGAIDGSVVNSGVVSPGDAPGKLTVNSSYTQTAGGTLNIGIGGSPLSGTFDELSVVGNVNLAGTLSVSDIGNFRPATGADYLILSSTGTLTGTFSLVPPSSQWLVLYTSNGVSIEAVPEPATILPLIGGVVCLLRRRSRQA